MASRLANGGNALPWKGDGGPANGSFVKAGPVWVQLGLGNVVRPGAEAREADTA